MRAMGTLAWKGMVPAEVGEKAEAMTEISVFFVSLHL